MSIRLFAFGALFALGSVSSYAQTNLETLNDSASYVVGVNFAIAQLKPSLDEAQAQGVNFDMELLLQAIRDVMVGNDLQISEEAGQQVLVRWQRNMLTEVLEKNNRDALEFFTANQKKPGVKVTPSGLQYVVLEEGSGASPGPTDSAVVKYRGTLLNGTVFDETKGDQTHTFHVSNLISGWTEALQMMKPGGKWKLFIPSNLAYGKQGNYGIPPGSALIFELELVAVKKP